MAFKSMWLRAMDPDTADRYSFILAQFIEGGAEFNSGGRCRGRDHRNPRRQDARGHARPSDAFFLGLTVLPTCFPRSAGTSSRSWTASSLGALALSSTAVPEHTHHSELVGQPNANFAALPDACEPLLILRSSPDFPCLSCGGFAGLGIGR
jgi:hypothetical protein